MTRRRAAANDRGNHLGGGVRQGLRRQMAWRWVMRTRECPKEALDHVERHALVD